MSIYFIVLEFLDILAMVAVVEGVSLQQPVLPQLVVELLILPLPPLLIRLTHHRTLLLPISHQQFSLLPSQVIQHTLIGGNLKVLVFFSLS